MRTIETKVYTFNELSDKAKETAISNYIDNYYDFWQDERIASYEKALEIYNELENIEEEVSGSRLVAWIENNLSKHWMRDNYISKHEGNAYNKKSVNGFYYENSYFAYKYNKCVKSRRSRIFKTNTLEDCPLTGVCYDVDFLWPIIEFMKEPKSNVSNIDLVNSMPSYDSISDRDYEYYTSDSVISEELENNESEFTEGGHMI